MSREPYRTLASHFRSRYGRPVRKIAVDAGFSCPNRDGTLGRDGCLFCSEASFVPPSAGRQGLADRIRSRIEESDGRRGWAVYFQAGTSTHATPARLRRALDAAASFDEVVALFVGTRPDALDEEKLDLLASYLPRLDVWLELGVQTAHDRTLRLLRRRHDFACVARVVPRAAERGLDVVAHVMLGLPGEGPDDEAATARALAALPLGGLKLHNLYVARSTGLARLHARGRAPVLGMEAYARRVVAFLERTPADRVMHRLMSDPAPAELVAPRPYWDKNEFLALVRKLCRDGPAWQGRLLGAPRPPP